MRSPLAGVIPPLNPPSHDHSEEPPLRMAQGDSEGLARLYQTRFGPAEVAAKDRVWAILCLDFFSRFVKPTDRVLDVAAGYCEFINHIECGEKYAYDANPDTARFAAPGVKCVIGDCRDMSALPAAGFDIAFVSNFFEHGEQAGNRPCVAAGLSSSSSRGPSVDSAAEYSLSGLALLGFL